MNRRRFLKNSAGVLVPLSFGIITRAKASNFQLQQQIAADGVTTASGSNITPDLWQTFEFTTWNAANLLSTCGPTGGAGTTGTWTLNGSHFSTSTSGQNTMLETVNGVTDTGTRGAALQLQGGGTDNAYTALDSSPVGNPVSGGFWLYVPSGFPNGFDKSLLEFYGTNDVCWIRIRGGVANTTIHLHSSSDGTDSSALTTNSWYWVTFKIQNGAACSCSIYDSSGNAITTQPGNVTGQASNITYFVLGDFNAYADPGLSLILYYDNICLFWKTSAPFPVLPK